MIYVEGNSFIMQYDEDGFGEMIEEGRALCSLHAKKARFGVNYIADGGSKVDRRQVFSSKPQQSSQTAIGNRATSSYILSFDKSTSKRRRSASETADHIMSERNRRQELSRKFIALSATIPGLKKTEKAHVLEEAIKYMKELEERVKVLEEDGEISITRSHVCGCGHETLPEVEARVFGKQVLIKIHCVTQCGVLIQIFSQLQLLHLSISSSNVLPFGNTLDITIIAHMGHKCSFIVKDLVRNLRQVAMLKEEECQHLPNIPIKCTH
ncbi:transcription factor bHLH18-like [Arachis duranensis]|uniref:Transcription factor bHLH18-like n=1 Tax=Arachis duranensis TaxID=130453 RepID=A0A9C6WK40_ARADU|nr:transcription factor bHLH18-like [Arachis duranensis]